MLVDGVAQEQWLVRWSDGTDTDATWEPASVLQQHYPDLRLEDKAISVGGGVDTVHEEDREPSGDPATVPVGVAQLARQEVLKGKTRVRFLATALGATMLSIRLSIYKY
ncbi:unnamed protein product [Cuscuta campestris]|uniref:Chromo domain-containing protein n=1 Tax=Cuscuta campestris TaxID=132261 RepID=A0A484MD56_9ASTE|nr:unnamed protein product [Cuscuta campestris]